MNEQDRKIFAELLVKAVQSGKQETSSLVSGIRGDIKNLTKVMNEHLIEHASEKEEMKTLTKIATDTLIQAKDTNGRVTLLEKWQEGIKGGGKVLKGVWGVLIAFIFVSIIGLFNMYVKVQSLPSIEEIEEYVSNEISHQLQNTEFELTE